MNPIAICLLGGAMAVGSLGACAAAPAPKPAPTAARSAVQLTIRIEPGAGQAATIVALDVATLRALPLHHITTRTPWYDRPQTFSGPYLQDVLDLAQARGQTLKLKALNDYMVEIPTSDLAAYRPVLAWQVNGKPLRIRDKGPFFLMYPFDDHLELRNDLYYGRAIWQVESITVH